MYNLLDVLNMVHQTFVQGKIRKRHPMTFLFAFQKASFCYLNHLKIRLVKLHKQGYKCRSVTFSFIQLSKNRVIMQNFLVFAALIALSSAHTGLLREGCPPKPPTVLDFDATKVSFFINYNDLLK